MDSTTMLTFCPTMEFARIEKLLREWPGVEAVGSLRSKEKKRDVTSVFVKFFNEEARKNADSLVDTIPGLSLTETEHDKATTTNKPAGKKKSRNIAAELINFGTFQDGKKKWENQQKRNPINIQKDSGNRMRRGPRADKNMTNFRGGERKHIFLPIKVNVAFVDNIPFNMTNEQVIAVFSPFGRVIDINRYELMAMIFYDSQEAVLDAIQHLNGKTLKGNLISVSRSSVKIPGHLAMQMDSMKVTIRYLDQTHGPHKSYKYTYMPDPRKLAPIETTQRSEILPIAIRPPTSYVPNHEAFLEKADIHRLKPTSDFKASFKDWNDLMTCDRRQLRVRGIPRMTRIAIRNAVLAFQNGNPPERFDTKEEWLYYKQFKTIDYSYRVIPELPEKYRPHQSGIDQAPLPDYREINKMPEWAKKEEERLNRKD